LARRQGGVSNFALARRHAHRTELGFHCQKNLFAQLVFHQHVAHVEDHGLIADPIADQLNPVKAVHGGNLYQGFLHYRFEEQISLPLQVDSKQLFRRSLRQRGQRIRMPASVFAGLGIGGLYQIDHCPPWQSPSTQPSLRFQCGRRVDRPVS
jgi:hypothetical protein